MLLFFFFFSFDQEATCSPVIQTREFLSLLNSSKKSLERSLIDNFLVSVLSTARNAAPSDTNSTRTVAEEDDDESLSGITLEEFKERYRRLIPYMTFYVGNNFVNGQSQTISQGTSANDVQQVIPLMRQNPQANPQFARTGPRRENNYRARNQEKKFVPSVQYDPGNVGVDNDYFTPVRYGSEKINYEYSTPYQDQKIAYPEIPTVNSGQNPRKENRFYGNVRPLRPYTTNGLREHPPRKQPAKPIHGNLRDDYVLDYNVRPGGNAPINYPVKDFQDHRQVPLYPNMLELIPGLKQPSLPPQLPPRNPNVNLQQIVESFQLSERLPETLNNDNIDNSLRMLVEILNILHSTKKEEFPQIQAPPLTPARVPQKTAANFKARPHTRPKVITESRFQATPNPVYLTDDPERYKATSSYEEEGKPKGSPQSSYNANSLTNNVVEYYIPVVQEIPTRYKEAFLSTIRPDEPPVDHSYAITEDIRDDILQKEQFSLPFLTTQSPLYTEPDEVSTSKQTSAPQTAVKYGATRGKANVDYPAYSSIPRTNFSCKEQRYKGFFGDPETGCQVTFQCFPDLLMMRR